MQVAHHSQLESWGSSDSLFELCPSQQKSQPRLQKVCLRFVRGGSGLSPLRHQYHALGQLVAGYPLALLP
jgi:hypothetical protein